MATAEPSIAPTRAASGILAGSAAQLSRRGLIIGAGAAAITAAGCKMPIMGVPPIDGKVARLWDNREATWRATKAAFEAHDRDVCQPMFAAEPKRPSLMLEHGRMLTTGQPTFVELRPQDIAANDPAPWWPRARFDALRTRWLAYEADKAAHERRWGAAAIHEEHERLLDRVGDAEVALLLAPAPHLRAFALKVMLVAELEPDEWSYDCEDVRRALADDARRFGGNA